MYIRKAAYFLIVLSGLLFVGCGGGSSSDTSDDSNPPLGNTSPVANAGLDQIVIVNNPVTLNGSGSADNDGMIITYKWTEGTIELSSEKSFDHNFTLGVHTVTLTVIDDNNATDSDDVIITVTDNITLDDFEDVTAHDRFFESDHFSGSQNCALCHDGIKNSNGTDVSIVNAWQGTMMANAATDPLYLAKVASEVKRNPEHKEIIEAKCSRCHLPMANVEAGFAGDSIAMSGADSLLDPLNPHYDAAKDGVSCTLCHQIEPDLTLGTEQSFSGEFVIADNEGNERKAYGPYIDPVTPPMTTSQNKVDFTPVHSTHIKDSKLCATCHNLNTPVIGTDGLFANVDPFPEQAVYTEWEYSDFNATQSCQECHMPQTEGSVIISTKGNNLTPRSPFHQHKFLGANTYMLEILKNNRVKLGALATEERFNDSIDDTKEFLKAAADVNITDVNFENGTLYFSVAVTNHSGHKFPTSLPTRRAWLHVKVTNEDNETVFESGAWDSSENRIIGVDDSMNNYEPHYTDINDSSQVQVYESIMADTDGKHTYTFMNAASFLKDNRLLPKGYKENTPASAQPYGKAVEDEDFVGGSDTVNYSISDLSENDEYTITVTLQYQTMSYGFAQDLYKDADLTAVALMKVLDSNTTNHFETISTDKASSSEQ